METAAVREYVYESVGGKKLTNYDAQSPAVRFRRKPWHFGRWVFVGQVNSRLGKPDDRGLFSMRRSIALCPRTCRQIANSPGSRTSRDEPDPSGPPISSKPTVRPRPSWTLVSPPLRLS